MPRSTVRFARFNYYLVLYVGKGGTEASGATRRLGIDFEGRVRVTSWLWADGDLNLSRSRFRGAAAGADRIPLAPSLTAVAGLTVRGKGPVTGGARGYAVWELFGRWHVSHFEIVGTVDNLFNAAWNEAQFATTSRLRTEPAPVTELHFTPGALGRSSRAWSIDSRYPQVSQAAYPRSQLPSEIPTRILDTNGFDTPKAQGRDA